MAKNIINVKELLSIFEKEYPSANCALVHENPLQLLISTILSAQCTDERVNIVSQKLFKKYKSVIDFANAKIEEFETDIKSTGFYKNKSKNIIGTAHKIIKDFNSEVPQTMEQLLTLPGVARKTANVVLGTAFGITSGIVVDTHVMRLSQRFKLTEEKVAEKIEQELMKIIPKEKWIIFSHQMILHGRKFCKARKPSCDICPLSNICPSNGLIS